MKLRAPATLYSNRISDRIATPAGIRGELESTAAAPTETTMLTIASGGEFIETMVRMAMPAAMAVGAAAIGVTN